MSLLGTHTPPSTANRRLTKLGRVMENISNFVGKIGGRKMPKRMKTEAAVIQAPKASKQTPSAEQEIFDTFGVQLRQKR